MTPKCIDRQTENTCLARNTKPSCDANVFKNNIPSVCKDCWCI